MRLQSRIPRVPARDDAGVSAVLVALTVVAVFIPIAAVAVDLSSAFSNRRVMQNAADAASMAGARRLGDARRGAATAAAIETAAAEVAQLNGQTLPDPDFRCEVVEASAADPDTWPSAPCTSWTSGSAWNGVRVSTHNAVDTFFAPALGILAGGSGVDQTEAPAQATAALQVAADIAEGPFGLCTGGEDVKNIDPRKDGTTNPPVVVRSGSEWQLNPAAVGKQYYIWRGPTGNGPVYERCGLQGDSWSGLICPQEQNPSKEVQPPSTSENPCTRELVIPTADDGVGSWVWATMGTRVGPTMSKIVGYPACFPDGEDLSGGPVDFAPCATVLPLCTEGNGEGGRNMTVRCVALGAFMIYPAKTSCSVGSPEVVGASAISFPACDPTKQTQKVQNGGIWGVYIGEAELAGGVPGGSASPGATDLFVVNMVQ